MIYVCWQTLGLQRALPVLLRKDTRATGEMPALPKKCSSLWHLAQQERHLEAFLSSPPAVGCPGLTTMKIRLRDFINDLPEANDVVRMCRGHKSATKMALPDLVVGWVGMASHCTEPGTCCGLSVKIKNGSWAAKCGWQSVTMKGGELSLSMNNKGKLRPRRVMRVMLVMKHMNK